MKRIAIIGMPNTGKSTFFNRLTGSSARVGNWPGVTVSLFGADTILGGDRVEIVDLPGIYDLHGFTEDEHVVRRFLENNSVDLVTLILNATQLDQQLPLVLQVRELDIPCIALLNMADEVDKLGIEIDAEKLSAGLGCPIELFSARYGNGFASARQAMEKALLTSSPTQLENLREKLDHDESLHTRTEALISQSVQAPSELRRRGTEAIDRIALHPLFGLPLFFLAMFLIFQIVYTAGAPLQDGVAWILGQVRTLALEPLAAGLPDMAQNFLLDGLYDGIATVASFVPIIILFFFLMALIEDSGYLARAAFLMDAIMSRFGMDGRGFVMMLMGMGCNVPALMGTRVMRTRGQRLLTMLVIPFSLCSARLQVFLFLTTALFTSTQAPLVLFGLYMMSFLAAFGTAWLGRSTMLKTHEPFILEAPPYRWPDSRQVLFRGWHEVRHFLRRASGFIITGVVMVWFLTHFPSGVHPGGPESLAGQLGSWLNPVLSPLGIGAEMAVVLLFGFVAKEIVIGAIVAMTGLQGETLNVYLADSMSWQQGLGFMVFILLYTPCVSTLATQWSESGSWRFTAASLTWSLGLAWVMSFVVYHGALMLSG